MDGSTSGGRGIRGSDDRTDDVQVLDAAPSSGSQQSQRGRHCGKGSRTNRFKGNRVDLEGIVYDAGLPNSNQDLFVTVLREIAEYIARKFKHAGEFCLGMMNLDLPKLDPPAPPLSDSTLDKTEVYKIDLREHRAALRNHRENQERIFPLILGQCSRTI